MPKLFQYRNIRHLLGMYITKQAEHEIYLIAQKKSYDGASCFSILVSRAGTLVEVCRMRPGDVCRMFIQPLLSCLGLISWSGPMDFSVQMRVLLINSLSRSQPLDPTAATKC